MVQKLAATTQVFNKKRLRSGELLETNAAVPARNWEHHPNTWTIEGTLQQAFSRLTSVGSHKARATSRSLDAGTIVAYAALHRQSKYLQQLYTMVRQKIWRPT